MKIKLSLALAAAVALAVAASPANAASKKKSSKGAKVTVTKSEPYFTANWSACHAATATWWFPLAVIGTVGCGVVYAVPVAAEGFLVPQGGKA